jgi:hypothetical protein
MKYWEFIADKLGAGCAANPALLRARDAQYSYRRISILE